MKLVSMTRHGDEQFVPNSVEEMVGIFERTKKKHPGVSPV